MAKHRSSRKTRRRSEKAENRQKSRGRRRAPQEEGRRGRGQRQPLHRGRVQKNPRGFAFLLPEQPGLPDAYVSPRQASQLMSGDLVEYRLLRQGRRTAAEVERVLERAQKRVVGTVQPAGRDLGVVTAEGDMHYLRSAKERPAIGEWIVADIDKYPTESQRGTVSLSERLGPTLLPKHDNEIAITRFGLPDRFSAEALRDAMDGRRRAFEAIRDLGDRKDLRHLPFVTIDGEDAKDFDDAVLVEKPPGGPSYILYVAIADVAAFVRPGTALDRDARDRGTSTYFPGFVIPMLPEELSNDLCSLRPQTDKLTLTAEIHFDAQGGIIRSRFYESLIKTARRLTYTEVHKYQEKDRATREDLAFLEKPLAAADELFRKMAKQRKERGVLDFDLPEAKMIVDDKGEPLEMRRAPRYESHRWIEEFMIAANREVARALKQAKIPTLYRVHESPDPLAVEEVEHLLRRLGFSQKLTNPTPRGYSQLLESTKGLKGAATLHQAILRLQKQAKYTPHPHGHFGLALKDYTHFTSPIRRYPDLVVHRALKQLIRGRKPSDTESEGIFEDLGVLTSERERRSMEAERWITKRKQCWYMSRRVGDRYRGTVAGVLESGVFVAIEELAVEGFLPLDYMDGFYEYDERRLCLVKRPGNKTLSIGDPLEILVASVSIDENQITFSMAE